jgi:hypothetical protein
MICSAIEMPDGVMFACATEPGPCDFCAADSLYLCDWPVTRRGEIEAGEVVVGDHLAIKLTARPLGRRGELYEATVSRIEVRPAANCVSSPSVLITTEYGTIKAPIWARVWALHRGTCDKPCCEAHVREVADERHYCKDHWNTWKEIR